MATEEKTHVPNWVLRENPDAGAPGAEARNGNTSRKRTGSHAISIVSVLGVVAFVVLEL